MISQVTIKYSAVFFFDDNGMTEKIVELDSSMGDEITIPSFKWHTYITISPKAITYETMDGIYHPETWKSMAPWAPLEGDKNAQRYAQELREYWQRSVNPI